MLNILVQCRFIDLYQTNNTGKTSFHIAAIHNRLLLLKHLLKFAEYKLKPDNKGMHPIHYAVLKGHFFIVQAFIEHSKSKWGEEGVAELVNS